MSDLNRATECRAQKLSSSFAEHHVVRMLCEIGKISFQPGRLAQTRVKVGDAEAGNDGVIGARHDAEEHWVGVLHNGPRCDLLHCRRGYIAEEEIGDIALEDNDFAVTREDTREHSYGSLKHCDDREHGSHAERDAGDADHGPDPVTEQISEDQLEEDHGVPPTASL